MTMMQLPVVVKTADGATFEIAVDRYKVGYDEDFWQALKGLATNHVQGPVVKDLAYHQDYALVPNISTATRVMTILPMTNGCIIRPIGFRAGGNGSKQSSYPI